MSTPHLMLKFALLNGQVGAIDANQREVKECHVHCLRIKEGESLPSRADQRHNNQVSNVNLAELNSREDFREKRPQPEGELIKVQVNSREDSFVQIRA